MKDTNIILYSAGAYGNFINWCCAQYSGLFNQILTNNPPLTDTGSMHVVFPGRATAFFPLELNNYINSSIVYPFLQVHESSIQLQVSNESLWFNELKTNLITLNNTFKNIIYIYPTITSCSWVTNNVYYKIRNIEDYCVLGNSMTIIEYFQSVGCTDDDIAILCANDIDKIIKELSNELADDFYVNWNHTSLDEFEIWELRELCAGYFYDRCHARLLTPNQVAELQMSIKDIKFIKLDDLRDNFEFTIIDILKFFKINNIPTELTDLYKNWVSKQYHINKDQQINEIVDAIINNVELEWCDYNLTFIDEIFIQRKLLNQNIAMACYRINAFPTNTKDFRPLLEINQ